MDTKVEKSKKAWINTRTVLWYLVFSGFAVNYMIRINLNIAIVSMIKPKAKSNESLTSECIPLINNTIISTSSTNKFILEENEMFDWNEYEQGLILGSFFWLHWLTQIPGGILANKYGTKLVFGLSNFSGVAFCYLIPVAAYGGYKYLMFVRIVQGLLSGFAWPAMHTLTARWIPPNERSKFVTAYMGSSIGAAITFPMCGYIISIWGWEPVFYISGILGTIWYAAWYFMVYDSPNEHPRISDTEKQYILSSLGESVSKEKAPVPWRQLLTSVTVWINVLAQFGGLWGIFTLMTHAPTYIKMIHGLNIKKTGILSGLPHIIRMSFAYGFSIFGDYLLASNKMSRTNVRKLATAICVIGQGFCMLGLAYSGCNNTMAIIFLTAAIAIHGSVSTGPLASFVDISPNYASILLGMANGAAVFGGFLSPIVVGLLTYKNQTAVQWQKVFWISTIMLFVSGTLYLFFAKSELQPWNSPNANQENASESEMVSLKKKVGSDDVEKSEKIKSKNNVLIS